jgi:hypothetical protein
VSKHYGWAAKTSPSRLISLARVPELGPVSAQREKGSRRVGSRQARPCPRTTAYELDLAELDLWLRACLALDWRGVQQNWAADGSMLAIPTLGLLHPLAAGLTPEDAEGDTPRLALRPDWASRLIAGHIPGVHEEAAARLHQVGWEASPWAEGTGSGTTGTLLAAALVPRCPARDSHGLLRLLAIPLRDRRDNEAQATDSTNTPAAGAPAGPAPR